VLGEQLIYPNAKNQPLNVRRSALAIMRVIAGSGGFKYRAQQINRLIGAKLIN